MSASVCNLSIGKWEKRRERVHLTIKVVSASKNN